MLKYSKCSHNLAVKCLAVADFCNVDVATEISDQDTKLTLELSGEALIFYDNTIFANYRWRNNTDKLCIHLQLFFEVGDYFQIQSLFWLFV